MHIHYCQPAYLYMGVCRLQMKKIRENFSGPRLGFHHSLCTLSVILNYFINYYPNYSGGCTRYFIIIPPLLVNTVFRPGFLHNISDYNVLDIINSRTFRTVSINIFL